MPWVPAAIAPASSAAAMIQPRACPVKAAPASAGARVLTASAVSTAGRRASRRQSAQASTKAGDRGTTGNRRGQGREASRRPRQWLSSAIQVSSDTLRNAAAIRVVPARAESARTTPAGKRGSIRRTSSAATHAAATATAAIRPNVPVDSTANLPVTARDTPARRSPVTAPTMTATPATAPAARNRARQPVDELVRPQAPAPDRLVGDPDSSRCSRSVSPGYQVGWSATRATARQNAASSRGGAPSTVTVPAAGRCRPARQDSSVDFPAPLTPVTATISPSATVRSTSSSTTKLP